jgi:Domain of unknown function (DUF1843)
MAKTSSKSSKAVRPKDDKPPVIRALYAVPIKEAAASGDLRQMKSMATKARKHLSDVQTALAKLEDSIAKAGG